MTWLERMQQLIEECPDEMLRGDMSRALVKVLAERKDLIRLVELKL